MGRLRDPIVSISIFAFSAIIFLSRACAQGDFQKGMCFISWDKQRYGSSYSEASLKKLVETGTEWVQIVVTCYQDKYDSKEIHPGTNTPNDKSLRRAIEMAHAFGLKVLLKPHIDLIDNSGGLWRADIGFQNQEDWRKWFEEYCEFLRHYARLAEDTKVELFCIGTELSFAAGQEDSWRRFIIPETKKIYSGKLTYAANWDDYKNLRFWDELDYIGIDAYFPLSNKSVPGYGELENACIKWADEIEVWQKSLNKPILFTEIGFRSCEFSAARPWDYASYSKVDAQLQADCYKAVLNVFCKREWFKGIYWWYWKDTVHAGGLNNRDYTPQNKPAQTIVTNWYTTGYHCLDRVQNTSFAAEVFSP